MKLGITTIQRDRGPWIVQWLAFHMMVGFDSFFFYAHKCTDDTISILRKLQSHCNILIHELGEMDTPQLIAYKHALDTYGGRVDWMAFVDGDEFLFPTKEKNMKQALTAYQEHNLSALAVYWMCYGSNGHIEEPAGLLIENFPRHSSRDFLPNKHIKSIVRGGEIVSHGTSHFFATSRGTFDESLRPILGGLAPYEPTYDVFRINHYVMQSYEYFVNKKSSMGDADNNPNRIRSMDLFWAHDRNECDDGVSYNLLLPLKLKVRELQAILDGK